MDNMTIIYLALGIQAVIIAVLLYVVLRQSQGLAASIPPAAFPLILNFIQYVVQLTPTKADDAVLDGLFADKPAQEVTNSALGGAVH